MNRRNFLSSLLLGIFTFLLGFLFGKGNVYNTNKIKFPSKKTEYKQLEDLDQYIGGYIVRSNGNDDTQNILDAIKKASLNSGLVMFPSEKYIIKLPLRIDISKVRLESLNSTIFDFSQLFGTYAVHFYSSSEYNTNIYNSKLAMNGIRISGGIASKPLNAIGILLGDDLYTENAKFTIANGEVQGFKTNIKFTHNSWRIKFENFNIRWGKISASPGLRNMGENISFSNCMIADGADLYIGKGGFNFLHCSMNNVTLKLNGDAQVHLSQCHLENPNYEGSGYRYISIEHINSSVFLNNCDIIFNSPKNNKEFTEALFYVIDENKTGGLHLNNIKLFQHENYKPWIKDGICTLVSGKGRVTFQSGLSTWNNYNGYVISRTLNKIHNPSEETGSARGWILRINNGKVGINTDDTVFKTGMRSLLISAEQNSDGETFQEFRVEPNKIVLIQFWQKVEIGGVGGETNYKLNFYNRKNEQIGSSLGYESVNSSRDWGENPNRSIVEIVPQGADFARISFFVKSGNFPTRVWLDEIIVNVI